MSRIDLSYIAGLFDGEGYFGVLIEKNQSAHPGLKKYRVHPTIELGLRTEDADHIFPEIAKSMPELKFLSYTKRYTSLKGKYRYIRIKRIDEVRRFISMIKPFIQFPSVKRKIELIEKIDGIRSKYPLHMEGRIGRGAYTLMENEEYRELLVLAQRLRKLGKRGRGQKGKTDVGEILRNLDTQKGLKA